MLKQVGFAHFEPMVTGFGPWKSQNALKRVRFVTKNGSKMRSSKCDLGPLGVRKQVKGPHFVPILTDFCPSCHMYAPSCTLRTYLKAVWWSHLQLGRGV